MEGGSTEYLRAGIEFIVYDYNGDEVVSYGSTSVGIGIFFAMSKSTWDLCFESIADEIFKNTPFN